MSLRSLVRVGGRDVDERNRQGESGQIPQPQWKMEQFQGDWS